MRRAAKYGRRFLWRGSAFTALIALGALRVYLREDVGEGAPSDRAPPQMKPAERTHSGRRLLKANTHNMFGLEDAGDDDFPLQLVGSEKGLLALYIPLMFWMFLALAIVCDEYF